MTFSVKGPEPQYRQTKLLEYSNLPPPIKKVDPQQLLPQHVLDALYSADKDYNARNYGGKISSGESSGRKEIGIVKVDE